jgi:hypothetical protein
MDFAEVRHARKFGNSKKRHTKGYENERDARFDKVERKIAKNSFKRVKHHEEV